NMKDIYVGLIGFGTVGTGVVKLLAENAGLISDKLGTRLVLKRIADLDTTTDRNVKLAPGVLTSNVNEIFDDPEIGIVIELIGGYEPAKSFVLKAISSGKHVVTANKALLALHGDEIYALAAEKGVEVLMRLLSVAGFRFSRQSRGTWPQTASPRSSEYLTAPATTS